MDTDTAIVDLLEVVRLQGDQIKDQAAISHFASALLSDSIEGQHARHVAGRRRADKSRIKGLLERINARQLKIEELLEGFINTHINP